MPAQGRVLRPEHGESAWGASRISPECPTSHPLGSLGLLPKTFTPSAAEALSSARSTSREEGRARQVIRLPVRRCKRDLAVVVMSRLRHPHISGLGRGSRDPHPPGEAGLRAWHSAHAPRVSRINGKQRKGRRNEKEIKKRFTTTVTNLRSVAGMEFHATEPAPTGPTRQAGASLPAARG